MASEAQAHPKDPQPIGWTWKKHQRPHYTNQRSSCGCWVDALTGHDHVGERCERRSSRWEEASDAR